MGKKDLAQSVYFDSRERFADMFNGVLFKGMQIIKADDLKEADSVVAALLNDGSGRKTISDKVWKWKGLYFSILSLENQTYVDYRMVFRTMKAEAMGYDKQWRERMRQNKKKWRLIGKNHRISGDEYLSGIAKNERFLPIITLILYLGVDKKWDGAVCLYDMLDIDEELKPFINNFRLNLFDYHTCRDFSIFKTENRALFEVLTYSEHKAELQRVMKQNPCLYRALDYDSARAISDIAGINIDLETIKKQETEGEVYDMCKAFEDYKDEGRQEGRAEFVIELLEELGEVPENLKNRIMRENDSEVLRRWHKLAAKAESMDKFLENM